MAKKLKPDLKEFPLPWLPYLHPGEYQIKDADGNDICIVFADEQSGEMLTSVAVLLASAPDLLVACELAVRTLLDEDAPDMNEALAGMQMAIARAKGYTQ